jgi:predicted nucleotidyltransferase
MIVLRAAFFGSISRGRLADESDVEILVEFEGNKSLDGPLGAEELSSLGRRSPP